MPSPCLGSRVGHVLAHRATNERIFHNHDHDTTALGASPQRVLQRHPGHGQRRLLGHKLAPQLVVVVGARAKHDSLDLHDLVDQECAAEAAKICRTYTYRQIALRCAAFWADFPNPLRNLGRYRAERGACHLHKPATNLDKIWQTCGQRMSIVVKLLLNFAKCRIW